MNLVASNNTHVLILVQIWRPDAQHGPHWAEVKVFVGLLASWRPWVRPRLLARWRPPVFLPPPSRPPGQRIPISLSSSDFSYTPFFHFSGPCDYNGTIWIISLFIGYPTNNVNSTFNLNCSLPWNDTDSGDYAIHTFGERHYSASHIGGPHGVVSAILGNSLKRSLGGAAPRAKMIHRERRWLGANLSLQHQERPTSEDLSTGWLFLPARLVRVCTE